MLKTRGMIEAIRCPQELLRNVRREFAKLLNLLQAYAVIGTGVRLICTNQVSP